MNDRRARLAAIEMHLHRAMNEIRVAVDDLSAVADECTDVEATKRSLTVAFLAIQRVAVDVNREVTS